LLLASVIQGVTWVTVVAVVKVNVWLTVLELLLMATITSVVGAVVLFSKADRDTPDEGTTVAPMR
jgi:hypothetical protein